jgi:hypothetical protein
MNHLVSSKFMTLTNFTKEMRFDNYVYHTHLPNRTIIETVQSTLEKDKCSLITQLFLDIKGGILYDRAENFNREIPTENN